jgi:hypothetical protein
MHYLVYQIENKVNNKIYVGAHITSDINDGYMGSGKLLSRAIKKYGIENFEKTILYVFESADAMFDKEAEIVNEAFVQRSDTYNIKRGGYGGWDYVNKQGLNFTYEKNRAISPFKDIPLEQRMQWLANATAASIEQIRRWKAGEIPDPHPNREAFTFKDRTHTDDTKVLMSKTHKERGNSKGEKNSQYGTCWVHDGVSTKKIDKCELASYISDGWIRGRINFLKK